MNKILEELLCQFNRFMFVLNNWIATSNFNLECSQNKKKIELTEMNQGTSEQWWKELKTMFILLEWSYCFMRKTSHFALDSNYLW